MTSPRDPLLKLVSTWQQATGTSDDRKHSYTHALENLRFLSRVKFTPYVPCLYSSQPMSFEDRFYRWITNPGLSEEQQRDLFNFACHISFFSLDDFTAMFQNAFSGQISRWCMSTARIKLDKGDWQKCLNEERFNNTWFCPITDSLLISVFHHVNGIEGKDQKPAFRELMEFGDKSKIHKHIQSKKYKRIVLLEDFVGTAGQSIKTVEWTIRTLGLPVLFCPMIIGPEGADKYRALKASIDQERQEGKNLPCFTFDPVLELDSNCFVHTSETQPERLFGRICQLAEEIHDRLSNSNQQCKEGAFGYTSKGSSQKGATIVMFSNTPNNSLPLIYHQADQWHALFPRVARYPL